MLWARKINDEFNSFEGLCSHKMFIAVWLIIIVGQILMILYGGWVMNVHLNGFNRE
jgi:hypothetical protein